MHRRCSFHCIIIKKEEPADFVKNGLNCDMKLKYELTVREIMGEYLLVPMGEGALKISGMGSTNAVGAFICKHLKEDCTYDELYAALLNEFEVEEDVAKKDMDEFLDRLRQLEVLS